MKIWLFICIFLFKTTNAQLSAMFGNPIQAPNCETWSAWGPCVWLKGREPNSRWNRGYFDQLLPGRQGCRNHVFFRLLRDRWGVAFENFYTYLREMTVSEEQCGQCSYQQSCGRSCHRRGDVGMINPLFVAERRCMDVDQKSACVSKYAPDCRLWPNRDIQLPNVTYSMQEIIDHLDYLTCVPEQRPDGPVCRCCCHPYTPDPVTFECELKPLIDSTVFG